MNRNRILMLVIVLLLALPLSACADSRIASSEKLVSGFYNISEQDKGSLSILAVEEWQGGYLAVALYTGSGSHLVLFKVEKGEDKQEKLIALCEGSPAQAWDCSVNLVEDSGKTILFGNIKSDAADKKYSDISFTFEGGTTAEKRLTSAGAYLVVVEGAQKVKDLALTGKNTAGTFKDFVGAGGSVSRTSFMGIK